MKIYVASTGPVVTQFFIPQEFRKYKTGVFGKEMCDKYKEEKHEGHALLIVGYGTEIGGGKDY